MSVRVSLLESLKSWSRKFCSDTSIKAYKDDVPYSVEKLFSFLSILTELEVVFDGGNCELQQRAFA